MTLPVTFATLTTGNQPLSLFDTEFAAVGVMGNFSCAASGSNAVALTPNANQPTIAAYANYMRFVWVQGVTSTAAVTLNVAGLGALNAYKSNGAVQCNAGDLVAGNLYSGIFNSALNLGAGGFVVDTVGVNNNVSEIPFIISGGGSAITTGAKGFLPVPYAATITGWTLIADQTGSITVDILRANNAVPSASIVGGGTKPTLSSAQFAGNTAPSGWTSTALAQFDQLGFSVATVATVTQVTLTLYLAKS